MSVLCLTNGVEADSDDFVSYQRCVLHSCYSFVLIWWSPSPESNREEALIGSSCYQLHHMAKLSFRNHAPFKEMRLEIERSNGKSMNAQWGIAPLTELKTVKRKTHILSRKHFGMSTDVISRLHYCGMWLRTIFSWKLIHSWESRQSALCKGNWTRSWVEIGVTDSLPRALPVNRRSLFFRVVCDRNWFIDYFSYNV